MLPNGNANRIILVVCLVIGGFIFFGILSKLGEKYSNSILTKEKESQSTATSSICTITNGKESQFENNAEEDDNQRKLSLGAEAARKV